MDENKLKKQLLRVTGTVITFSVILCIAVFCTFSYLSKAVSDADYNQMKTEIKEYKSRIMKQIDKNFEILTTLAEIYEACGVDDATDILKKSGENINKANSFISLAYFSTDETGFINTIGQETIDCTVDRCNPEAQKVIRRALNGEKSVSKMFDSEVYNGKLFVYSVPVYSDGRIAGAIAASDTMEIFEDIVNGNTVMDGNGYVHLLAANGDFLIRSENTLVKEKTDSIFDGPYLSDKDKITVQEALDNNESYYGEFNYKGEHCHFYMEPMDMNGWYLFCAERVWEYRLSYGRIFLIIIAVFCIMLAALLFMMYLGYYKFRRNSASLLHLVSYDTVTGAKNTFKFDEEFRELIKNNKNYSVIALNIHNFKGINDLFGRSEGDRVLCYVKSVVESNLNDGEFFCRDAADMFYILMLETDTEKISSRVEKIIKYISETSASYGGYGYDMLLYAGAAVRGDREKALVTLQSIQGTHSKTIAFYNEELHEEIRKKNNIESYMHQALQNKEFKMFLQPKFNLKNDELVGAEALVRWQKPDGTYRYPNEFIPLFESNGFCIKLDTYMIEQACEQLRKWMDDGLKPVPISVNQSKILFLDKNYPDNLEKILDKYNIPSSLITLEILEGIASDDLELLKRQIDILHSKGFKVSMDDFGKGYSSLNMLYQLRIDELKLDRGFLKKVPEDDGKRRYIILRQVISLAKKLGIKTVAEGIETAEDREAVIALSCDYGQGYLYGKPIDSSEFGEKYIN